MVAVLLDFGALIEVRAVFDGELVQMKAFAQELERALVLRREIDPAQRSRRRRGGGFGALEQTEVSRGIELEHAKAGHEPRVSEGRRVRSSRRPFRVRTAAA